MGAVLAFVSQVRIDEAREDFLALAIRIHEKPYLLDDPAFMRAFDNNATRYVRLMERAQ